MPPVPADTARVARAAFPKGNPLMRRRDELGAISDDETFAHLFPTRGQPAEAPWRLALVTILQFAEDLSDRQAAEAVRARIDWKYALSLELTDPGFDASVLCEFRARLLEGDAGHLLLDVLLRRFRELALRKARGKQRTDSTHVWAAVRARNRLELVRETLRHALDVLTEVAPGWLLIRQTERGVRFRTAEDGLPPSAQFISSPYDADAHLGKKRTTCWIGDQVSLTETCEDDLPHLITHVETTAAPTADGAVTPQVHEELQAKDLLPAVHLVDTGFLDAELIVTSKQGYGVELLGPTRKDRRWQARAGARFGADHFSVDFRRRKAVCPAGHESVEWVPRVDNRGNDRSSIRFSAADCGPCPRRATGTTSRAEHPRRSIAVRPAPQDTARPERRDREEREEDAREDARRAGGEGTISQGIRRCGLRRSRSIGLTKTHRGHVLTAAALNVVRVAEWLADVPRAHTRPWRFAELMAHAR